MADPIIYSIGDIHGCLEAFLTLLSKAKKYHEAKHPDRPAWLVTLGDYVDRGQNSMEVMEILVSGFGDLAFFDKRVHLLGNHDAMMLAAIDGATDGDFDQWLYNGGKETLASYGCTEGSTDAIPGQHFEWLLNRPLHFVHGSFLFVHAGIYPGRPLEQQKEKDLLWIRDSFTRCTDIHEHRVVHGHTVESHLPVIKSNRINLDTGAFMGGGTLTCLAIDPTTPDATVFPYFQCHGPIQ